MPDEIAQALAVLSAEADRAELPDPAALRRTGTRRTRLRVVTACAAVLLAAAGTYAALPRRSEPPPPVPGATPSPSPSPHPCNTDPKACVPPSVYFQDERLPAPCETMTNPSDAQITARETREAVHHWNGTLGRSRMAETRTWYLDDGAQRYMTELRQALVACPSVERPASKTDPIWQTVTYGQLETEGYGGDDHILLSRTYAGAAYFMLALRLGNRLLVVIDYGMEGTGTPRAAFDSFALECLSRFLLWHPS
ncbi:hypothetical protein ABZS66_43105 [Dactylosporangium sp. NPDC005572]|uniref:hypothetical protein n=1 Tax=Dactylosporangium sp. NPDC005572 TaxID=3156889 RepID=UPI0033A86817